MLLERLADVRSILSGLGRPVVDLLRPGLPSDVVTARLGTETPEEVVQWFSWSDGVAYIAGQTQDEVAVIPGYSLPSLDEAVSLWPHFADVELLAPHWVPLLVSGGGDFYAAAWGDATDLRIIDFLVDEGAEETFSSADQMLEVFVECYRRGAFFVDRTGMLAMIPDLCDEVQASIVR